jgi:hypothetical protein
MTNSNVFIDGEHAIVFLLSKNMKLEDRDFVGYGSSTPDPQWPNGAK